MKVKLEIAISRLIYKNSLFVQKTKSQVFPITVNTILEMKRICPISDGNVIKVAFLIWNVQMYSKNTYIFTLEFISEAIR